MCKYIFVSGGVVSGLGKGITAASLGRLLKNRGIKVTAQKLDPYINVDPGTMSPYQHGEVFVTEDGSETDLDLGHYERFMDENLNRYSNLTTGKVYWNVLNKEREGKYLGETVQVIPHITDEIKHHIYMAANQIKAEVLITEIGGTVGDIESQPYLEAIRQVAQEQGKENCLFIHVTLVPYIAGSCEYKSKPTQHSVKELQSYGIMPDMIVARCETSLPESIIKKISLFCNITPECVIENIDLPSLYEVTVMLEKQSFARIVCEKLRLSAQPVDLKEWNAMLQRIKNCKKSITIALIGKYVQLHDAYLSVVEALNHGGFENERKIHILWIDSESLEHEDPDTMLAKADGILIPGGFGDRGIEGKIIAAQYAREHQIPFLGICLGMQIASIEFARHVLGYDDADSYEFHPDSTHRIIDFMSDQSDTIRKGGTMRLGAYPCHIKANSRMYEAYGQTEIRERHRHRYEFNNDYRKAFIAHGMNIVGTSMDETLVEAVEISDHPFYIGVQFHPEFKSRPNRAHPLFAAFVTAACDHEQKKTKPSSKEVTFSHGDRNAKYVFTDRRIKKEM